MILSPKANDRHRVTCLLNKQSIQNDIVVLTTEHMISLLTFRNRASYI